MASCSYAGGAKEGSIEAPSLALELKPFLSWCHFITSLHFTPLGTFLRTFDNSKCVTVCPSGVDVSVGDFGAHSVCRELCVLRSGKLSLADRNKRTSSAGEQHISVFTFHKFDLTLF